MKRTSMILTLLGALWLSCLFGTRALAQTPPSGLTYKRLWTDSIRLTWNAPDVAKKPSVAKSAWMELPLEHTQTYHMVGIAQGTNTYPVTDGNCIYMNVWSKDAPSKFFKYDVDGTYMETFTIEGLERSLRDLTYDGQYFYGGFEGINSIAVLDLANKKLVKTIAVDRSVRHISYIPTLNGGSGGFEIGDINSCCFIDMNGKMLKDSALAFHLPDNEFTNAPDMRVYGTAYHKGKIYAHCYLGVMEDMTVRPIVYNGPYSSIVEYDVETGLATGRRFNLAGRQDVLALQGYMAATGLHVLENPKGTFNLLLGFGEIGQNQPPLVMLKLESRPLPDNLSGYNLYADGVKVNAGSLIDKAAYSYAHGGLPQGQDVHYELKAVYGEEESAAAELTVHLPDSRLLPFYEDFNSLSFNTNYWTIANPDAKEAQPWSVRSVASSIPGEANTDLVAYQGNLDQPDVDNGKAAHSMTLVSKTMNFKDNVKVFLRFQTAQNVPFAKPTFCDTLFLEINTGSGWRTIWQDTTVGNGKPLAYEVLDITAQAAGKSDVRFRFRVDGNSFEKSSNGGGFLYHLYIDNFRIWEPVYVRATGTVLFNGAPVSDVAIRLTDGEEALIYETTTNAQGNFTVEDMQTGIYRLTAFRAGYNPYEAMVEIISESHTMAVNLLQPAFSTVTEVLEITMRPNETLRSGFALGNSGTGDMVWRAAFDFPNPNASKADVESGVAEFPVLESWRARGNVETSYAYLNDTIYSFYRNNTLNVFELLKTLPDGTPVETGTVLPFATDQYPQPSCIFADDTYLYFGKGPKFYRYDISSGQITDSVETSLNSITYAAWHSVNRTFLVGNRQEMLEYDASGTELKSYAITGLNTEYIAVDAYSREEPVLWMACGYKKPDGAAQGEYVGLYEYSLSSMALTGRYFVANRHPEYVAPVYAQRQTTNIKGLFGSDQLVPGRFTLFVTTGLQKYSGTQDANLCAVYDVAQSVKWIGMETYKGALAAGETSNFYLNFNTEDLKHGDKRNCIVTLSADIAIAPYVFPVRLTVDSTYESPCAMPTGLSHSVSGSQVDLSWRVETAGGALVTENIEGYLVRRNGMLLTDELLKEASFRDLDPVMGVNVYEVQAFYKFPTYECNSSWSAPDTVRVVYTGDCATATGLKTTIDKQRHVTLTWDYPQNGMPEGGVSESFETMAVFSAAETLGNGWTTVDRDRAQTYGLTGVEFPHAGEALPFIVFNPYATTPAISDRVGAYSGRQMVASFSSRLEGVTNNDWLISPELDAEQPSMVLNFMAKSAFFNYGYEELKVAYSTTGKNVEDFVFFEEKPLNVPGEWTEYNYRLPKGTKYVALNCVSKNKFMLLIDDIYVGPMRSHMRLESYAVYKNGELMQEITPRAVGFFDYALQDGSYIYEVAARYNNGCVSAKSEPVKVDIAFKHGITSPRALSATINKENESVDLNWKEPAWGEAEEFSYHNGMQYGFALSDPDGAPAMFSVGMAITMNDPTLLDYSLSALRIGFFDACDAEAFIIDMTTGQYVARQVIPHVYEAGFITVGFDHPVKMEYGKSYLVGYELLKYYPGGFPAGTDNGPVVSGGDFISFNGIEWGTVGQVYGDNFNWTIDAILEVVEKPEMTAGKAEVAADTDALRKAVFATDRLDGAANRTMARQQADKPLFYRPVAPLSPKSGEPEVAISGYTVSRGGEALVAEPQQAMTYSDKAVENGKTYRYQVTAVYANGEKASSDFLQVVYLNDLSAEETLEAGFDVYTAGKTVLVENRLGEACDILIRNLSGHTVASRYGSSDARVEFSMNHVPHGFYLVCIYHKDKLLVKKVVL